MTRRTNRALRTFALAAFPLLASGLCACSTAPAPALAVVGARVADRSPEGVVLALDIDAANEGPAPLPLAEVEYRVWLADRLVFEGTRAAESTLRRRGVQRLVIPAAIAGPDVAAEGEAFRVTGRLTYLQPGLLADVLFDAGVRRPKASFSGTGVVSGSTGGQPAGPPGGASADPGSNGPAGAS